MVKVEAIAHNADGSVDLSRSMLALGARGKTGPSAGYGATRYGFGKYGNESDMGGIFQRRVTGYNQTGVIPGRPRKTYWVRMKSYRTPNPRTPAQQANRAKMADAVAAWAVLDPVEKSKYNERGKRDNKVGRNMYISWYLKNH